MQRILFLSLVFLGLAGIMPAQSTSRITYEATDSVLTNPERGFYRFSSVSSKSAYSTLNLNTLLGYRDQGYSVLFRYFYLENFSGTDISASYLAGMEADFNTLRQAGMKAIIRFAYSESMVKPYGDAPLPIALRHIEQLKPLLQKHSDVILVLQAGFIGAWGEWYYTSNYAFSPGVVFPEQQAKRNHLVDALLDALPANRMIQLRTPVYKFKYLGGDTVPLTYSEAYTALPKARLAHHNDCFVASTDDYGTYDNLQKEKYYLERDSKYLLVGGETCNTCTPCSDCPNALAELARFHWSVLNIDYHPGVLAGWRNQGCFETVVRKLGYRYVLLAGDYQTKARPGGAFKLSLQLENQGFSNPVNPRLVEFILRNTVTGLEYRVTPAIDPRQWELNAIVTIDRTFGLPAGLPTGNYKLFLAMPDPEYALYSRPEYAVRMANNQVWEKQTGYNDLNFTLQVEANMIHPSYSGGEYFNSTTVSIVNSQSLFVDGSSMEWGSVPLLAENGSTGAQQLKLVNSADSLFVIVKGVGMQPEFQLFIDADRKVETGYHAWQWLANGSDYLIENNTLYSYTGVAGNWGWTKLIDVNRVQSDSVLEFSFSLNAMTDVSPASAIGLAFVNDPQGVSASYLPVQNGDFSTFNLYPLPVSALGTISWAGNNRLYWPATDETGLYTVLQRKMDAGPFVNIASLPAILNSFLDAGLDSLGTYQYRIYHARGSSISLARESGAVQARGKVPEFLNIQVDGSPLDWSVVAPLATGLAKKNALIRVANFGDSLFFSFLCPAPFSSRLLFDIDRDSSSGITNQITGYGGYEYCISNDSLLKATDNNWEFRGLVFTRRNGNFSEGSVALKDISFIEPSTVRVAVLLNDTPVPAFGHDILLNKYDAPLLPEFMTVSNSAAAPFSRVVIEWSRSASAAGYVLERSVDDMENFTELARLSVSTLFYHDNTVDTNHFYYYRLFAYNGIYRSIYSWPRGGKPGALTEIVSDVKSDFSLRLQPNPVSGDCVISVPGLLCRGYLELKVYDCSGRFVSRIFGGFMQEQVQISFNSGYLEKGFYILKATGDGGSAALRFVKE